MWQFIFFRSIKSSLHLMCRFKCLNISEKMGTALRAPIIKCTDKAVMLCPSFDKWNGGLGSTWKGNCATKYIFETIESMTWDYLREYKLNKDTKTLTGKNYKVRQKLNKGKGSKNKWHISWEAKCPLFLLVAYCLPPDCS